MQDDVDRSRSRRWMRGQAFVEMALTLPILIILLMGIIDVGFVLYAHTQVAAAAREGARTGAAYPALWNKLQQANDGDRLQAIKDAIYDSDRGSTSLGFLQTSPPAFDITTDVLVSYPDPSTSVTRKGERLVVTVRYRQLLFFDLLPGIVLDRLQVENSTTMRIQ